MNDIATDQQRPDVGTMVNLYTLDATAQGGAVYRFVPGPFDGAAVTYQGHRYSPLPITLTGLHYSGEGAAARPRLTVSALDQSIVAALLGTDHLRGATVTRLRTLSRYLDGEADADPARHWPAEVYRIEQLVQHDPDEVVWQLASTLDFDRKQLPGRQVLRDVCSWTYRVWDGTQWDYTHATCPYTGSRYFNREDQAVTTPADDDCSQRVSGCRARFPNGELPFGGFIGVARVRG